MMQKPNDLQTGQTVMLSLHTHTHGLTVQGRDDIKEGSASSVPGQEPEMVPKGQASVSTPLQSAADPPSLEKAQPEATTAAPEQESSSLGLSSAAEPAQSGADSAGTVADDVFSTADEIFSAPDSPHKEFHSAVLRALSKEPSVVEAAESGQVPGTADEAESCLTSGLPLHSSPAQPWSVLLHTTALGDWGSPPAVSFPVSEGLESAAIFFPHVQASSPPTVQSLKPLLDYFSPHPPVSDVLFKDIRALADQIPFCSLIGRGAEERGCLGVKSS